MSSATSPARVVLHLAPMTICLLDVLAGRLKASPDETVTKALRSLFVQHFRQLDATTE